MMRFIFKRSTPNQIVSTKVTKKSLLLNYIFNEMEKSGILEPTADYVMKDIDLSNKTCLITGANSGIGLEMTRSLTKKNATVLMACRNKYVAEVVAKSVCEQTNRPTVCEVNLASLSSVKKCSDEILKNIPKLDMVILNAGVFGLPWTLTEDLLETTFQVNYLSQYCLLMNIEKILAPDARVVFVTSESHRHVSWPLSYQLVPTKEMVSLPENMYTSIKAYNVSNLCRILLMHYLGYRWLNTTKSVFCACPGSFVKTGICRNWWVYEALYTTMRPFAKNVRQAAATPIYCATSPDLNGLSDQYYKDLKLSDESHLAKDLQLAYRMHDLTRELVHECVSAANERVVVKKETIKDLQEDKVADHNTLVTNYSG